MPKRFAAYGWQVIANVDGHDAAAVSRAIGKAKRETGKPTLICCKTIIGKGAPTKANTGSAHGAPLGDKEIAAAREAMGWPHAPFVIPDEVYAEWTAKRKGARRENEWKKLLAAYSQQFPQQAAEFNRRMAGDLPTDWPAKAEGLVAGVVAKAENIATRKASQNALEVLVPALPEMVGGSADLAGSNLTMVKDSKPVSAGTSAGGNYVFYGVREFGMAAIMNGLSLYGGLIPYGATFLTFSDYARNALRMAALMKIRTIYVFTHDSIGLGEDGPTHQSVEHASSLRLIPNMDVWRPADGVETAVAWVSAVERKDGPTSLLLSRQNLPPQQYDADKLAAVRRGGYVLSDAAGARAVIMATGSELQLAMAAQTALAAEGIPVRVVSMPGTSVFDRQDAAYRASVLGTGLPRIAIEAGVSDYWRKYVGAVDSRQGAVIGIDRYGESAPAGELFKFFGFTVDKVVGTVIAAGYEWTAAFEVIGTKEPLQ